MSDSYVGEIRIFAGNYAPEGWAMCNGQLLPINGNDALFALIGTTYGGDGQTNFAVPDLRSRLPVHMGTSPRTGTGYVLGESGGAEEVVLTVTQLPSHTHQAMANATADSEGPANAVWAGSALNRFSTTAPDTAMDAAAVEPAGASGAHDNVMPSLPLTFIISLDGYFPTQG